MGNAFGGCETLPVCRRMRLLGAAGFRRVTLVRLEKGEQTPRFKTLGAIAGALGVDVSDLLVDPGLLR